MGLGRTFLSGAVFAAFLFVPSIILAQEAPASDAGVKRIGGIVNARSVYVRSRASEDAYPTMMLNKGDEVTVVGAKGNFLKIIPPKGSFAYVPKSFVQMHGDGTVGKVTKECFARVGSNLNELAAEPMASLHLNQEVQITGQQNEYFKIVPPSDGYLWIAKQFVDPKPDSIVENKTSTPETEQQPPKSEGVTIPTPPPTTVAKNTETTPTTKPSTETAETPVAEAQPPATQPARFDAIAEYDALEKEFPEATKKPILEQPLPDLIARYQKVIDADELPSSMRQIAQIRVASLQARNEAREKFLAVQNDEKKMSQKQQALVAERQEIEDRIKQNNLEIFVAVGTLRTSSLQIGQGTLYRLTDPATGRTVAYIRSSDSKLAGMLGQFIGVRGNVTNDLQLKTIIENPTDVKPVDPEKVNRSVAAQFVPPSLVRFASTPSSAAPKPTDGQASIDKDPPQQD